MKALVILYEGRRATALEMESFLCSANFISKVESTKIYTEDSISKLLVESSIEPPVFTDDGDNAVTYIASLTRSMDIPDLSVSVITYLNKSKDPCDEIAKAYVNAVALLSQDAKVSAEVAKKYRFTKDSRNVIKKLYNAWKENVLNLS